ncbi:aspartate ammonia-lyase [Candidatus Gottesmanbacteria bacterium]|nr:aspartate ammonia-lyase [Candidatus Gottesmanbacteria bacterium]
MKTMRDEKDSLGTVAVPKYAYYGAQTVRAQENFLISGITSHDEYIQSIVVIKKAAARVNHTLGFLPLKFSQAIETVCDEIRDGKFSDQFIVDVYQAGAGTSIHMNVNEVIANRANELLDSPKGSYSPLHPNDHINMAQSTNDVIPTAIRIAVLTILPKLFRILILLEKEFIRKERDFHSILKPGRTHLQDAVPILLGQEFSAYGVAIQKDRKRINKSSEKLLAIGIGGTAVGTGINSHPRFHRLMVTELQTLTKLPLRSNKNLFESMQNAADFLELSSSLRILAQTCIRIGNDLRLLSSGPKAGLSEIRLPEVQPGSSIMPGKVNPSIIEMLTMVCFQVIGMDLSILLASQAGQLELNVMYPLIAYNLLEQIRLLTSALTSFQENCLKGITANPRVCAAALSSSHSLATLLTPLFGFDKTAKIVKDSYVKNIPLERILVEEKYMEKVQINKIFHPLRITKPNRSSMKEKIYPKK